MTDLDDLERRVAALERGQKRGVLEWVREYTAGVGTDPAVDVVIDDPAVIAAAERQQERQAEGCEPPPRGFAKAMRAWCDEMRNFSAPRNPTAELRTGEKVIGVVSGTTEPRKPRECYRVMTGNQPYGTYNKRGIAEAQLFDGTEVVHFREILRDSTGNEVESEEVRRLRRLLEQHVNAAGKERFQRIEAEQEVQRLAAQSADECRRGLAAEEKVHRLTADLAAEQATLSDVIADRDRLRDELAKYAVDNDRLRAEMSVTFERAYASGRAAEQANALELVAERNNLREHFDALRRQHDLGAAQYAKVTAERDVLREFVIACYQCGTRQYAKRKGYRQGYSQTAKCVLDAADAAREE